MSYPQDIKIEEVFNKIEENKKKIKNIKKAYSQALEELQEYTEIKIQLKTLKAKKKQIEQVVKERFINEMTEMEDLKIDLESDKEMLSDLSINKLIKGETISLLDKYSNEYEPIIKVSYKKI